MKNLAAMALALSLVSFSGFASEEVVTETPAEVVNCEEAYRAKSQAEIEKRADYVEYGFNLYVYGSLTGVVTGQLPITVVTMFTGLPMNLWGQWSTGTSTKTMNLMDEESKQMKSFVKKLKRELRVEITEDDVRVTLQEELDNGNLCADYPKLMGHNKIKKHLKKKLAERFN